MVNESLIPFIAISAVPSSLQFFSTSQIDNDY
ncbi:hypothetical protein LTSESEN_3061, partial [Salmonella enterica subsp. enterica serovar Senftenberg str. A4-543]